MTNRYAHTQFADDIRFEVGNKTSVIGIYAGEMFLPFFPCALPKLCIAAYFSFEAKEPIKSLGFKVTLAGQEIENVSLPESDIANMITNMTSKSTEENPVTQLSIGGQLVFSPLNIEAPSVVTVTAVADGVEYLAGKLRIFLADQPTM